jgi:hypothetical protein
MIDGARNGAGTSELNGRLLGNPSAERFKDAGIGLAPGVRKPRSTIRAPTVGEAVTLGALGSFRRGRSELGGDPLGHALIDSHCYASLQAAAR